MEASRKIVIAGGSGFLGRSLARRLAEDPRTDVVLLSRNRPSDDGPWTFQTWDAGNLGDWTQVLERATALVNLVGRTAKGDLIVHDPWGDWMQMYRGAGVCAEAGRYAIYPWNKAQSVLNNAGDRVWSHFIW